MDGTVKTALIVGGVAIGVVVLIKTLSPSPTVPTRPKAGTDLISVSNLIGAGSALSGLFGSKSSPAALSAGDKQIFDTVTDKGTGAVDLSGVYDNSGIVDTVGDTPG